MSAINGNKPVLVTGATGYVAGRLVEVLLDKGHTVHAPIRNPEDQNKTKYLNALAKDLPGSLVFFKADLLEDGSYTEAMDGCELVFHTASPFTSKFKDAQKELVEPAVIGTHNILRSANQVSTVKKVVLTSSCAAIYGDTKDIRSYPNQMMTEEQWNESSSLSHNPYSFSKTIAEKEAWKVADKQDRWKLVVINPSLVIGPGINPYATSESFNIFKQLGNGKLSAGVPEIGLGLVDVRDLAIAHYRAGFYPDAEGRHIIAGYNSGIWDIISILKDEYGEKYAFPRTKLPKWLVWIAAPIVGFSRKFVSRNVGYPWRADNSKSIQKLNMEYRPLNESVIDFFEQIKELD
jgi:dihydroflavonol-4-reductase